jgi:hypothetical protein
VPIQEIEGNQEGGSAEVSGAPHRRIKFEPLEQGVAVASIARGHCSSSPRLKLIGWIGGLGRRFGAERGE